jgi:rhamnulokinase
MRSVAIDLGAGSCRITLAEWDGREAKLRPVHRYPNGPVERDGHLYWELERLCQGAEEGLRLAAERLTGKDTAIHSVGVDGWAVDYVRLDAKGKPLGDPFCYRDPRTGNAMAEVWRRIEPERIYELTGIQFLRFNTLYQLYADRRDGVEVGARWLNIPEYLLHRLAGFEPASAISEYTNSTHTQLLDARRRMWCDEIFQKAGLDRSAAPPLVFPGTQLGPLKGGVASLPPFQTTKVIAPACHDTGAAVAGIPDAGADWAFLSSGTWSLLGAMLEAPCTSAAARSENFTNEGGVGGRIRFLKNINGMWLIEECLREWDSAAGRAWTLPELLAECERKPLPETTFNVDAPDLILPGRMPWRINRELEKSGHAPVPEDAAHAPEMANVIFASLAARYAEVLRALGEVTGRKFRRLYVVGGGSQNEYLNRLVAEQTGLEVVRSAVESSTIGNLAIQFASLESGGGQVTPTHVASWAARLIAATPASAGSF